MLLAKVELDFEDDFTYPQNRVMEVNSMNAPGFNWDYDGDNMSAFSVTTKQGLAAFPAVYLGNHRAGRIAEDSPRRRSHSGRPAVAALSHLSGPTAKTP